MYLEHHIGLIESHNVFAHIFAGSRMICFGALAYLGFWLLLEETCRNSGPMTRPLIKTLAC